MGTKNGRGKVKERLLNMSLMLNWRGKKKKTWDLILVCSWVPSRYWGYDVSVGLSVQEGKGWELGPRILLLTFFMRWQVDGDSLELDCIL